jgi:hypothetical protein
MECRQWAIAKGTPCPGTCFHRLAWAQRQRSGCSTYFARNLAHLSLQFHGHTTPITRRKLCSRVERRARRLAAGARAPVQTREKLVRQDSSLMMMKDLELLQHCCRRGVQEKKRGIIDSTEKRVEACGAGMCSADAQFSCSLWHDCPSCHVDGDDAA